MNDITTGHVAVQPSQHRSSYVIPTQMLQQVEGPSPISADVAVMRIAVRSVERLSDAINEVRAEVERLSDAIIEGGREDFEDSKGNGDRMRRAGRDASIVLKQLFGPLVQEDATLPGKSVDPDATGLVWGSHAEFYAMISALLGALKEEWLNKYQDGMAQFLEFYKEFSDIMEKLKPTSTDDKGVVTIDFSATVKELNDLLDKYGLKENALAEFKTKEEAERFAASFGLPGLTVGTDGDKHYVYMDVSNVKQLIGSMTVDKNNGPFSWDSARYNAWVSSRDSNLEQIRHMSKVFGEKLSEMMQKFDSIAKILSSTIEKISESDNNFVRF